MRVGSLFSGIGGLDLGLEWAGMEVVWQVEIDDWCRSLLGKRFPNVAQYADIKECRNMPSVDLICGGFPCQDVSLAGKRKGLRDGTRTGLWQEMARIIREVGPRWVLAENVPGLLSAVGVDGQRGEAFGTVLRDLDKMGYDAEWCVLSAGALGAPHRRERVFVVAWRRESFPDTKGYEQTGICREAKPVGNKRHTRVGAECGRNGQFVQEANEIMADAVRKRMEGDGADWFCIPPAPITERLLRCYRSGRGAEQWAFEPDVLRMADGFSEGVDEEGIRCEESRSTKEMCVLRGGAFKKEVQRETGGQRCIPEEKILQQRVHGKRANEARHGRREGNGEESSGGELPDVRCNGEPTGTPRGLKSTQQRFVESDDPVRFLSHFLALASREEDAESKELMLRLRRACVQIGYVSETLSEIQEIWRSITDEEKMWVALCISTGTPWCSEWPEVTRLAHGVPDRIHRLRALGNAVVPQCGEFMGQLISMADETYK